RCGWASISVTGRSETRVAELFMQITLRHKVPGQKIFPAALALARGPDQRLHLIEITLERLPARRRQPVLRLGKTSDEELRARHVLRFLEFARVHAKVSVGRVEQLLEVVETERFVDGERAHDPKPHLFVNEAVERDRLERPCLPGAVCRRPARQGLPSGLGCARLGFAFTVAPQGAWSSHRTSWQ